jgi:hypothetical protein
MALHSGGGDTYKWYTSVVLYLHICTYKKLHESDTNILVCKLCFMVSLYFKSYSELFMFLNVSELF